MSSSILVFLSIFALASVQSENGFNTTSRTVVLPGLGKIKGSVEYHIPPDKRFAHMAGYVFVALNIPFAKPPVHERRFAPPEEFGTWNETIDGDRWDAKVNEIHQWKQGLRRRSCHQDKNSLELITQASNKGNTGRKKRATEPEYDITKFWMEIFGAPPKLPLYYTEESEDCLYLNVWVPLDSSGMNFEAGLPVMVWLHGGGFTTGSALQPIYEGIPISMAGHIILVTVNYRLSSLGFLYNGEKDAVGNMGLMDQAMAIKWVRDNIKNFGGDTESITIYGESAGSASVNYQMLAPMSRPNFKRAIMQSGNAFNYWAFTEPEQAKEQGINLGRAMGCDNPQTLVACLRGKNATDIMSMGQMSRLMFTPTKDQASLTSFGQDFIPKHPEELLRDFLVDLDKAPEIMLGMTENEGALFLPMFMPNDYPPGPYRLVNPVSESLFRKTMKMMNKFAQRSEYVMEKIEEHYLYKSNPEKNLQSVIKFISQNFVTCNTTFLARKLGSLGKVAMYRFNKPLSYVKEVYPWMGAAHALELPFLFGRPFLNAEPYTDAERMSTMEVASLWTHFAKHGIDDSIPASDGEKLFLIDDDFKMTPDMTTGKMKFEAKMMSSFDDQCHFIDCLPSLELFGDEGELMDQSCMKYTVSGSEKTRNSMVLSWFLAFGLLFLLREN